MVPVQDVMQLIIGERETESNHSKKQSSRRDETIGVKKNDQACTGKRPGSSPENAQRLLCLTGGGHSLLG
jgi:hypothetical protein